MQSWQYANIMSLQIENQDGKFQGSSYSESGVPEILLRPVFPRFCLANFLCFSLLEAFPSSSLWNLVSRASVFNGPNWTCRY